MTAAVADLSVFVQKLDDGVERLDLAVDGITCAACIPDIEQGLALEPGVTSARVNLTHKRLAVEWRAGTAGPERIVATLARLGYRAHPFDPRQLESEEAREAADLLKRLGVAAFATMNIMLLSVSVWAGNATDITPETRDFFHWLSALIAIPAVAYSGQPFFRSAAGALKRRALNMDVPISLGVTLAIAMSIVETLAHATHAYFDSAAMLLTFLLLGRYLDVLMRRKTRAVAANLAALRAVTATRILPSGELVEAPIAAISRGDLVLARAGDRIGVDGVVEEGRAQIDQSFITGETAAVAVGPGDRVYAGALALDGALRIRVDAARGALIDEVNRLVETAVEARAGYRRLADRAAQLYSPVVHVAALATFLGWLAAGAAWQPALIIAITVLIITCPCALALAIPAVQVVAAGALFRRRILLHAGDAIERLAAIDTVVFDKTGTLTRPDPTLIEAEAIDPAVLHLAGRLAAASRHPLALALHEAADRPAPMAEASEVPGVGVEAMLDGERLRLGGVAFCEAGREAAQIGAAHPDASLIAFRRGETVAVFAFAQTVRADARATIDRLKAMGLKVVILSGDRPGVVAEVAETLGVETAEGGLTPLDKIEKVRALAAAGAHALMVGDGLNDAPALAGAHASMAPITGLAVAQAAADAVFMGDNLRPVADALAIARKARRLMIENLWLAVVYNLIAVPVAVAGLVTPLIAALAMSGSSLIVTLNALRAAEPADRNAAATNPATAARAAPVPTLPARAHLASGDA